LENDGKPMRTISFAVFEHTITTIIYSKQDQTLRSIVALESQN